MRVEASNAKPIEAVTFDVGGTLIECWPSVGHVYAEVAARHGYAGLAPEVLNRKFKSAWKGLKDFRHTRREWAALVDATFDAVTEPPPSQTFFPELYERFSHRDAWHVFEDVETTLSQLKARGIRLGIISNWDERLRPLLRTLGLDSYFETVVVSCELGACKPARVLFETACERLGSRPDNTLHVGDSYKMDVAGARAAGLQARWLQREQSDLTGEAIATLGALDKL